MNYGLPLTFSKELGPRSVFGYETSLMTKISPLIAAALALCCWLSGCVSYRPLPQDTSRNADDFESRTLGTKTDQWTLQKLTEAAFRFHPSLAEAKAEVQAADAAIVTARQRPNPSATFAPEYNFTTTTPSPWIWGLAVEVPIETGGKRAARTLKAQAEANAARCKLATAAQKVRSAVREAVVELAAADARVALLEEQRHIQEDLVKLLRDRVGAGETPLTELNTYQLSLNRAALDVSAARRDAGKARAALAAAVGVPAKALTGIKVSFDLAAVHTPENSATRAALKNHPEVLAALSEYAVAEAALKLEITHQYPDLKLSNGFLWDQADKKWQLPGLGMELPVFHRNQGAIGEAMAKRKAAAARLVSAQAKISGEISIARATLEGAQAQAREASSLLESERKAEEQSQKNLKVGGGDRLEVLTTKVQSAAGRVSLLEAQVLAQQAATALESAVQPAPVIESLMKPKP